MNRNRLKTLASALVVASSLAATTARAEDVYYQYREENQNALMFDPGALINGVANFEYERALNELFGITVGMNIDSYKSAWYANAPGYVAIGPELGVRFHFIRAAPRGFWIGPYLDLAYVAAHAAPAPPPLSAMGWAARSVTTSSSSATSCSRSASAAASATTGTAFAATRGFASASVRSSRPTRPAPTKT